jgi:hypothetical protein
MKDGTQIDTQSPTDAPPTAVAPTQPSAATPDKMAPFRKLFGMPVAVQFMAQAPYVQVAPLTDNEGTVQAVQIPNTTRVIGLPAVAEPQQAIAVATGVLHPSEDGTWLIIEERIGIPRSAHSLGGQALMDVYVRPEFVTHISFVKAIELRRPARDADA